MLKVNHLENNKKIINILMISGILLAIIIFLFEPKCLFKEIFNIPCSICGMTRAFKYILNGNFLLALKLNLLSVPLIICLIVFYLLYFISNVFNKNYIYKFYAFVVKNYKILIAILFINWVINIVKFLYY